jgi:hypothetical protein
MQKSSIKIIPAGHPGSPGSSTSALPVSGADPSMHDHPEAADHDDGHAGSRPSRKTDAGSPAATGRVGISATTPIATAVDTTCDVIGMAVLQARSGLASPRVYDVVVEQELAPPPVPTGKDVAADWRGATHGTTVPNYRPGTDGADTINAIEQGGRP